jgi:asparagine synthase (glutamine-hydrolysing)
MRGILPELVRARRDKLGFSTPERAWIRDEDTARFRRCLVAAVESSRGLIRNSALTEFDRTVSGRRRFDFFLWRIINFGRWLERFNLALP